MIRFQYNSKQAVRKEQKEETARVPKSWLPRQKIFCADGQIQKKMWFAGEDIDVFEKTGYNSPVTAVGIPARKIALRQTKKSLRLLCLFFAFQEDSCALKGGI